MLIYFMVGIAILPPLLLPKQYKEKSIIVSFAILFIMFGLQYEMTRDWYVYVERWRIATEGFRSNSSRDLELIYVILMSLCKPFGFFIYLILCAIFNLFVFYKYLKKYVPVEWFWLMLLIFILRTNFAMTYIDTNRQTLAITLTMIGIYSVINPPQWFTDKRYLYLFCSGLFLSAVNIHTSAIIAIPIFFFPIICKYIKTNIYLYPFLVVFALSFIVDFSSFSLIVEEYMQNEDSLTFFSQYSGEIASRQKSIIEQSIYAILLFFLIHKFLEFKDNEKPIVIAVIVYISFQGYAMYTMLRALFFYQVYSIYVIPILFCFFFNEKKWMLLKYAFLALFVAYCLFSFNKEIHRELLESWLDFRTIFSAPKWM